MFATGLSKPAVGTLIDPSHSLARGLVGCWLFNEGAGSRAGDASLGGNFGTLISAPPWVGSIRGGPVLSFDGSTQYITLTNRTLNVAIPFSISMWLKTTTNANTVVFENNGNSGFSVQTVASGNALIKVGGGTVQTTGGIGLSDGYWHNVVFVISAAGSGGGAVYINGGSTPASLTTNSPVAPSYGGSSYIGGRATTAPFPGLIDDVRLYNRILSSVEIGMLCNAPFNLRTETEIPMLYVATTAIKYSQLERSIRGLYRGISLGSYH